MQLMPGSVDAHGRVVRYRLSSRMAVVVSFDVRSAIIGVCASLLIGTQNRVERGLCARESVTLLHYYKLGGFISSVIDQGSMHADYAFLPKNACGKQFRQEVTI